MIVSMADRLSQIDRKTFAAQLHTLFKVQAGGADSVSLELAEVRELPAPPGYESFSLVFRGPAKPRLPQQTYRFEHQGLGSFDLFVTAIAGDAESLSYEAVLNRRTNKQA